MRHGLLIVFSVFLVIFACKERSHPEVSPASTRHDLSFETPQELQEFLAWSPDSRPLIGAHRGGPMPGFPENSIEAFENGLYYAPLMIECDVRQTKDGVLIMMHDETLDRTTTGSGKVEEQTWESMQDLFLTDNGGVITNFRIPSLADALKWGRGKAIIELDIKRGVPAEDVVAVIEAESAAAYTVVITYNLNAAMRYHRLNPDLVISAPASGIEGTERLLNSGIPAKNIIAWTGVFEPPREVYNMLHEKGISAILGTLGNLDRRAKTRGISVYLNILENGADIIATDNVPMMAEAINRFMEN